MQSKLILCASLAALQVEASNDFFLKAGNKISNMFKKQTDTTLSEDAQSVLTDMVNVEEEPQPVVNEDGILVTKRGGVPPSLVGYTNYLPAVANTDKLQNIASGAASTIKTSVYTDSDTWSSLQSELNQSADFSYAQLFSQNVFMAEVTFATQSDYWAICIGDDGTYGGVCFFNDGPDSGSNLQVRMTGTNWSTALTLMNNCNSSMTSINDCLGQLKSYFTDKVVDSCTVSNYYTQNGLNCFIFSEFIEDQSYVLKGWQSSQNYQGYPQLTDGASITFLTIAGAADASTNSSTYQKVTAKLSS